MHLRLAFITLVCFCIGLLVVTRNGQTAAEMSQTNETIQLLQAELANTVSFEEKVRFTGSNGEETIAPAGMYQVEPVALTALRLLPFDNKEAFVIKAEQTRHNEDIGAPIALLVADDKNLIHVLLLMPQQKGLEAIGSISPGRSRGAPRLLTQPEIHDAILRKKAAPHSFP